MDFFEINQKWLDFILSLQLDSETKSHYASQITLINKISESGNLDVFLTNLKNVHTMKNDLSNLMLEYNNKKDILKTETKDIMSNYNFSFNTKEKSSTPFNTDAISKGTPIQNSPPTSVVSKNISPDPLNTNTSYSQVSLKNSNVLVSSKFYNDDSIEKNLELRISNKWINTDKDSICRAIMPILNEMLIFSEEEFLSVKKRTKFKYYLQPETFYAKFVSWELFTDYIGAVSVGGVTKIQLRDKDFLINDVFNNSLTVTEILKLHSDHGINWIKESKSFIGFACLPILNYIPTLTYNDFSLALSKYPYKSLMSMKDIKDIFGNWEYFLDYLGVEFYLSLTEDYDYQLKLEPEDTSSELHMTTIMDAVDREFGGYADLGSEYLDLEFEDFDSLDDTTDDSYFNLDSSITNNIKGYSVELVKEEIIEVAKKELVNETKKDDVDSYFKLLLTDSIIYDTPNFLKKELLTKSKIPVKQHLYNDLSVNEMSQLFKTHKLSFDSNLLTKDLICYAAMPILNRMFNLTFENYNRELSKVNTEDCLRVKDIKRVFGNWPSFTEYLGCSAKIDVLLGNVSIKRVSKFKLKNSNYFVYNDFENSLSINQILKVMATNSLSWRKLSKNDIAYVSMLILNTLKVVNMTEFINKTTDLNFIPINSINVEFGGWIPFKKYIGLEYREPLKTQKEHKPENSSPPESNVDTSIKSSPQKLNLPLNSFYVSFKLGLDQLDDYNDENSYVENFVSLQELDNKDPASFENLGYKLYPSLSKVFEQLGTDNFMDSLDRFYLHYHKDFKTASFNTKFKQLLVKYTKLGNPKTEFEFTKQFFSSGNSKTFIPLVLIIDMFGSYPDYLKLLRNWESEQNN